MRAFLGILTGYMIIVVSTTLLFQFTQHDPHAAPTPAFALGSIVWGILSAGLAGFIAAKIAQGVVWPSAVLGLLIATLAIASLVMDRDQGSLWSPLSALIAMSPAAFAGGMITRRKQR
jgi:hypothetical protein